MKIENHLVNENNLNNNKINEKKTKNRIIYKTDKNIIDLNIGNLEGTLINLKKGSFSDLKKLYYLLNNHIILPKNCESEIEMKNRLKNTLENLEDGIFLFFTHAGVIYKIRRKFAKKEYIGNCGAVSIGFNSWDMRILGGMKVFMVMIRFFIFF